MSSIENISDEEVPTVTAKVKLRGVEVGEIMIESNGTFSGEFTDGSVHRKIVNLIRNGFADGVIIETDNTPQPSRPGVNATQAVLEVVRNYGVA